ncbi:prephenate dehydratase [Thermodesulfobacteriota bacterium]
MDEKPILLVRDQIDSIDKEIVKLLGQRAQCALEIGKAKQEAGIPRFDPARERAVISGRVNGHGGPLPKAALKFIFTEIISACRELQAPTSVSCLGPEATFSHLAAQEYFGQSCTFLPRDSIADVFREVERGQADYGVVPVENSSEGAVGLTLDQLAVSELKICGEICRKISHALISREKDLADIKHVLSHPQALAQCRGWLARHLPGIPTVQMSSTSAAAKRALEESGTAALGSDMLAWRYGLEVLARDIQDWSQNMTRFLVLGKGECPATGQDRTSIVFATPHRPGALANALTFLADYNINLTRIESRPSKETPWHYVFFIDFDGHISDDPVKAAMEKLARSVEKLKLLGSYPVAEMSGD